VVAGPSPSGAAAPARAGKGRDEHGRIDALVDAAVLGHYNKVRPK
jgi:hypothetical protein